MHFRLARRSSETNSLAFGTSCATFYTFPSSDRGLLLGGQATDAEVCVPSSDGRGNRPTVARPRLMTRFPGNCAAQCLKLPVGCWARGAMSIVPVDSGYPAGLSSEFRRTCLMRLLSARLIVSLII